ncbi:MAG: hypothetical protein JSR86_04240 [Proteobacteria bacterium]|nr:hypothetical protein [Pseudomonadota bacterium]
MSANRLFKTCRPGLIAALSAAALAASASGARAAGDGLAFGGEAPLVCAASLTPSAGGDAGAGQLREFCNDPNGFQVWVDYPAELANASLLVDGVSIPLSAAGTTRIDAAAAPGQSTRTLLLQGAAGGGFTVRIVPL